MPPAPAPPPEKDGLARGKASLGRGAGGLCSQKLERQVLRCDSQMCNTDCGEGSAQPEFANWYQAHPRWLLKARCALHTHLIPSHHPGKHVSPRAVHTHGICFYIRVLLGLLFKKVPQKMGSGDSGHACGCVLESKAQHPGDYEAPSLSSQGCQRKPEAMGRLQRCSPRTKICGGALGTALHGSPIDLLRGS